MLLMVWAPCQGIITWVRVSRASQNDRTWFYTRQFSFRAHFFWPFWPDFNHTGISKEEWRIWRSCQRKTLSAVGLGGKLTGSRKLIPMPVMDRPLWPKCSTHLTWRCWVLAVRWVSAFTFWPDLLPSTRLDLLFAFPSWWQPSHPRLQVWHFFLSSVLIQDKRWTRTFWTTIIHFDTRWWRPKIVKWDYSFVLYKQ